MDARSGDSFIAPYTPGGQGNATPRAVSSAAPASPKKSKNVRIAFASAEVSNTAGSVSRVDLTYLARRLHVPVERLSRSLADTAGLGGSLMAEPSRERPPPQGSEAPPGERRSPGTAMTIGGAVAGSYAGPDRYSSVGGSVREWFGGAGSVSRPFTIRKSSAQRVPSHHSVNGSTLGTPGLIPTAQPLDARRPSVRLRFVPSPQQRVLDVDMRGRSELGVTWEGWEADSDGRGIVAKCVAPGSAADAAGVMEGMRLVCIDGVNINTESDLQHNLAAAKANPTMTLIMHVPHENQTAVDISINEGQIPVGGSGTGSGSQVPLGRGRRLGMGIARSNRTASNSSWDENLFLESPNMEDTLGGTHNISDDFDAESSPLLKASSPRHSSAASGPEDDARVEIDIHENGAAQVAKGKRASAYVITDPNQQRPGMVLAVPKRDDDGVLSPNNSSQRSGFFGSLRRVADAFGFSASTQPSASPSFKGSTPLENPQPEPRRVAFADDIGDDLVTSIRQYEEIDTVVIEFKFHFPPWVWATLVLAFLGSLVTPALMLSASQDDAVPVQLVLAVQCLMELGFAAAVAVCFIPLLIKESYEYLKGWGWVPIVVSGVCYSLFRVGTVLLVHESSLCKETKLDPDPQLCPPIFFECLAPLLLVFYFSISCYLEMRHKGVAETPVFPLELVGLLLVVGGAGVMLVKQHSGMNLTSTVFGLLASVGMAVDMLMKRDMATQLPVPLSVLLSQIVAAAMTLIGVTIFSPVEASQWGLVATNKADLIISGFTGFATALFSLLVLRHLHPYPMSATLTCSHLVFIAVVKTTFGVQIDTTSTLAIPAVFVSMLGGCLAIWSNLHHRSVVEVEIVQEKRLNRRKATGIKGPNKRNRIAAKTSNERLNSYSTGVGGVRVS